MLENTYSDDWAMRYFVAQVYVDLYSKEPNSTYLEKAYEIAIANVNTLKDEQQNLNTQYLDDDPTITLDKPIKDVKWSVGDEMSVHIYNGKEYEPLTFQFKVVECKKQFLAGTKPIFEEL